jgi:uncharacterized protein YbcV (DUF1398 family)
MFTLNQIQEAHQKVQSGADFPAYAGEIHALGVTHYDVFVADGHAVYLGNPEPIIAPAKYHTLIVAENVNSEKFITKLRFHQSGGTDYMTFCRDCAECGVEKWTLNLIDQTCIYYDREGKQILVERFGKEK